MASVRQYGTEPELTIRKLLHRAGLRFRVRNRDLPGSPDIVLPRWLTVILVHGCFWHGHDCSLFKLPSTNTDRWRSKIEANIVRDKRAVDDLIAAGWRVILVWQCAIKGHESLGADELTSGVLKALRCGPQLIEFRGLAHRQELLECDREMQY